MSGRCALHRERLFSRDRGFLPRPPPPPHPVLLFALVGDSGESSLVAETPETLDILIPHLTERLPNVLAKPQRAMPCCSPVLTCAGARDRETWIPQRVGPFPFIRGAQAMRGGESKNSASTPEGLPNQPPRLPSGKPVRGGGARPTAEVANEIGSLPCHTILKRVPCLHVSAASVPVRGL